MTKKIAVSLPDEILARAKRAVARGKAPNVSNYIALLIEQQSASESFDAMIADFIHQSGASAKEIRAAERRARSDFRRAGLPSKGEHGAEAPRKAG